MEVGEIAYWIGNPSVEIISGTASILNRQGLAAATPTHHY